MKRIILCFAMIMMVISDMCAERHMTFLGLPIDGTIYEFKNLMVDKGFKFVEERDQFCFLEGMFTGKDVTFVLVGTPITKTIWKVMVKFKKEIYWADLQMSFREYEDLYKKKYGEPTEKCETILPPHKEYIDDWELALKNGLIEYHSIWDYVYGSIVLRISPFGTLQIFYQDELNDQKFQKESEMRNLDEI